MSAEIEVVLAHYNGSKFIDAQINSILESARKSSLSCRILILDDCSHSEEFKTLQKIVENYEDVILHRNQINLGVVKTFAVGLGMTSADYVMLSDQDDVWRNDKIAKSFLLLRQIESKGPSLVFTDLEPVDTNLKSIRTRMLNIRSFNQSEDRFGLLLRNVVAGCTTIMNRKLIELALPFPKAITMHDHWLALCAAFGGTIGFVNEPTMLYRQHGANIVGQRQSVMARLLKPTKSFHQLDMTLNEKSRQIESLINRLNHYQFAGDRDALIEVQKSILERNFKSLLKLRKNGALRTFGLSQIALWPAFLLTSFLRARSAQ